MNFCLADGTRVVIKPVGGSYEAHLYQGFEKVQMNTISMVEIHRAVAENRWVPEELVDEAYYRYVKERVSVKPKELQEKHAFIAGYVSGYVDVKELRG